VRSLRDLVAGLPRTFWFLWTGLLINRMGGFVYPFLVLYLTSRGLTVAQAGRIVALYGAGSFAAALVGGRLSDLIGRRRTMLFSLFGGGTAMLALGLVQHPAAIAVLTFVVALISDQYRPAVFAIVADVVPPADRPRAFNLNYWAVNLGFAIASVLAGVMADWSYFWLFAGDAATTFACGVLIWRNVPETHPERASGEHVPPAQRGDFLAPFRDSTYVAFVLIAFLTALLFFQAHLGLPVDMKAHGLSAKTYGAVIAINGVMIVLLQPFATRLTGGRPRSLVMSVAAMLVGAGFGVFGIVPSLWGYVAGVVIFTIGEILQAGISPTIVSDLAPVRLRGTYQGVYHMAWGLASLVGPGGAGQILDTRGAPTLWATCFFVGLCSAAGHLLIAGSRRKRLVELREAAMPVSALED
jgi:MFS family permease